MVKKITFTPDATLTLHTTFEYLIEEWSEKIAVEFLEKVIQTISNLYDFPEMYFEINKQNKIRRALISPHVGMYYRIKEAEIEIITFFDQRQNPKKLKLK